MIASLPTISPRLQKSLQPHCRMEDMHRSIAAPRCKLAPFWRKSERGDRIGMIFVDLEETTCNTIPDFNTPITCAPCNPCPVRGPGQGGDLLRTVSYGADPFPGLWFPYQNCSIFTSCGNLFAIRRPGQGTYHFRMFFVGGFALSCESCEDSYRRVITADCQVRAVWRPIQRPGPHEVSRHCKQQMIMEKIEYLKTSIG